MSHRFLIPLVFPGVGTEYSRKNQVREATRPAVEEPGDDATALLALGVGVRRRKRAA